MYERNRHAALSYTRSYAFDGTRADIAHGKDTRDVFTRQHANIGARTSKELYVNIYLPLGDCLRRCGSSRSISPYASIEAEFGGLTPKCKTSPHQKGTL